MSSFQHSHIKELTNLLLVRVDIVMVMIRFITYRSFFSSLIISFGNQSVVIPHQLHSVRCDSSHCSETWNCLQTVYFLLLRFSVFDSKLQKSPKAPPENIISTKSIPRVHLFSKSHCCRKAKHTAHKVLVSCICDNAECTQLTPIRPRDAFRPTINRTPDRNAMAHSKP